MRRVSHSHRPAFTLVELLMVVTIIGILVGLIVPAVYIASRTAKSAGLAMEINSLANAIDQYKNKYGDYPPDGSNAARFEQHYRKVFPQMLDSEFVLLHRPAVPAARLGKVSNGAPFGVMDPAEAIVFALGGFSEDPAHPFTGPGGPFSLVPSTTSYQYNIDRNNPFFEFKESNLTLQIVTIGSASATLSSDESELQFAPTPTPIPLLDALPVYRPPYGLQSPYVYFEFHTYSSAGGPTPFFNNYSPPGLGAARPYKSGKTNTNVPDAFAANADRYYRYENEKSFQLISAGLDDIYGGVPFLPGSSYSAPGTVPPSPSGGFGPMFYAFPTGESVDYGPVNGTTAPKAGQFSRYYDVNGAVSAQLDNVTNFSDGQLKDGLNN